MSRSVGPIRTQLGGELDRVVFRHFRNGGRPWWATKFAVVAAVGCWVLHWASADHNWFVEHFSAIRDYQPFHVLLFRLPLSLVAPAPHLPVWGAIGQVLIVFWLAELNLGVGSTLVLIAIYHFTSTVAGRFMVELGPHAPLGLGVAHVVAFQRDTGPSAAVVGLCVYVGVKERAPVLAGLVAAAMIAELIVKPDQAGREHVVAMVVALLTAIPIIVSRRRAARRRLEADTDSTTARATGRHRLLAPRSAS